MELPKGIFWIGHASFYIKAKNGTIFIDPFRISDKVKEKADLVLITHAHFDHCNKEDIEKVRKEGTKFIAAPECLDGGNYGMDPIEPGKSADFNGITIRAVPAYNHRQERLQFHPKEKRWVGYVIEYDNFRVYHAGDTDSIPEMGELKGIDVALLPMGGTYTMAMEEALEAANAIKPKIVVPMHYKMILGEEKSKELENDVRSKLPNASIMREVQDPVYSF